MKKLDAETQAVLAEFIDTFAIEIGDPMPPGQAGDIVTSLSDDPSSAVDSALASAPNRTGGSNLSTMVAAGIIVQIFSQLSDPAVSAANDTVMEWLTSQETRPAVEHCILEATAPLLPDHDLNEDELKAALTRTREQMLSRNS